MSKDKLAALRASLAKKTSENTTPRNENGYYPFWNASNDSTTVVRFLPDGDENNPKFWVERAMIDLPFQGIVGKPTHEEVIVSVPCMHMYGEKDAILTETQPWWNDPETKPLAQRYYKKRKYLFQGFVTKAAFEEDNAPENPIRRFSIGPKLFKLIETSLTDETMEDYPVDYEAGCDFNIRKTRNGEWPDYGTSSWARKNRSLDIDEIEAIEKYDLIDLSSLLPTKPDAEHLAAIFEMFTASVNDEAYDPARWSRFYGPRNSGFNNNTETVSNSSSTVSSAVKETVSAPVVESKEDTSTATHSGDDISAALARLRGIQR